METLSSILMAAAVIAVIILLLKIIAAPMKLAFKLLLNALFFVFNFFGDFVGFTLGINWVNALITGCLGVPGVILLILIKLFF
jgi:inhibitor of the pro-sigma K processing machinery